MTTKGNKTKKIMGRPRKDDTTHIGFRITFKDRESLRRISKILGITVSKYMKDAVLKQLDKDLKEMEESSFTVTFQNGVELDGVLSEFFNLEKNNLTGNEILKIAYELLLEIRQKIRVKFIWLECQNNEKILNFYQNFGFSKIDNFISESGYNVMIMELK